MKISISSPFPIESLQGNSVSARRIGQFLQQSGHQVNLFHDGYSPDSEVFIALNAWRSAPVIKQFAATVPGTVKTEPGTICPKIVVMMTGSDIYSMGGELKPATLQSIDLADHIVVTTDNAKPLINHPQISVIRKSIVLPHLPDLVTKNDPDVYRGVIAAHLREQKNPFLFLRCLRYLKSRMKVDHYGEAPDFYKDQAKAYRSDRYQWHEPLPREHLLAQLTKADFYLNTSSMEGSSNALCEAICLDIPVIASDIPGNSGVLGEDYVGLFTPDDPRALAIMLDRFVHDNHFFQQLTEQCKAMKATLDPKIEKSSWEKLIASL